MKEYNKGLTLIEVLVATTIITIVLGLGGLSLAPLFKTKTDGYAKEIGYLLTETRYKNMAYADQYYFLIKYDPSTNDYIAEIHRKHTVGINVVDDIVKSTKIVENYEITFKRHTQSHEAADTETDIKDLPGDNLVITFKGSGAVKDNSGIIYIKNTSDNSAKQIDISDLTGKVVVSDRK